MRYYGKIGFKGIDVEVEPGYWETIEYERFYSGDVIRNTRRLWEQGTTTNDSIVIDNHFSIVADAFANDHIFNMQWIEWAGSKWKISNVEVRRPRLILICKEVWNG